MNETLTTELGRHNHPPEPEQRRSRVVRRVGVIDRIALHIGIALVSWSRRPRVVATEPQLSAITPGDAAQTQKRELAREMHAWAHDREQQVYPRFIIR